MADRYQPTSNDSQASLEGSLGRDSMTLSQHVLQQLNSLGSEAQDLSAIMNRIAFAGKLVSRRLTRAGLVEDAMGFTGRKNVQGESVKKMDEYANDVFISVFQQSGLVCRLVSEEMDEIFYLNESCSTSRYTLLYDPIDGSSNVDINLNVGSIFALRRQQGDDADQTGSDLLTPGHDQLVAGYILYGPSTVFVYSIGKGVHSFTLDPSLGEFILSSENIQIPQHGSNYSVNEGNFWQWEDPYRAYIRYMHRHEGYSGRYSGALVGDFHRILMQGGVFLYPGTLKKPEGKLRLLYESAPLAFLAAQAGGRAIVGDQAVLDVQPNHIHMRTPLIIGSSEDVALVESFLQEKNLEQPPTPVSAGSL